MYLNPTEPKQKGDGKMEIAVYERKPVSPKIRFEVFKRDDFTCQYCGRKPPDVELELEHIIPVKRGGGNDITNLLTACAECNIGKSFTLLDDYTLIKNQYREIINQNNNIRKVKKMHKLKQFYEKNKEIECKVFEEELLRFYGIKLDENGRKNIRNLIRKYGIQQIFESLDNLYSCNVNDDITFNVLLKQIRFDNKVKQKPYLTDLYYIRKILINKFDIRSFVEKNELYKFIEFQLLDNYDKDTLISCALDCSSIKHFYRLVEGNRKE